MGKSLAAWREFINSIQLIAVNELKTLNFMMALLWIVPDVDPHCYLGHLKSEC